MQTVLKILRRVKIILRNLMWPERAISNDFKNVSETDFLFKSQSMRSNWKSSSMALRQRKLVDQQLKDFRHGKGVDVYNVLAKALSEIQSVANIHSVLEVGCSSGYYSEVFKLAGLNFKYTGCDYSSEFIELAKSRYSDTVFDVYDAIELGYKNQEFDVVISGNCLLHIPEYKVAIKETARVAKSYVIFHRTPIVTQTPNLYFEKLAYGTPTIEIHFNESELLEVMTSNGLILLKEYELSREIDPSSQLYVGGIKTYVFGKQ